MLHDYCQQPNSVSKPCLCAANSTPNTHSQYFLTVQVFQLRQCRLLHYVVQNFSNSIWWRLLRLCISVVVVIVLLYGYALGLRIVPCLSVSLYSFICLTLPRNSRTEGLNKSKSGGNIFHATQNDREIKIKSHGHQMKRRKPENKRW